MKVVSRNHRLRKEVVQFIDGFSETYGLSKSAVVNFALRYFEEHWKATKKMQSEQIINVMKNM
jgi:hypothetical protein